MLTRAAALTAVLSLLASSAFAGTASRSFHVGVSVVRSAKVTTSVTDAMNPVIRVEQVASRGTPAPLLLAGDALRPMSASGAAQLLVPSDRNTTITVLY